jgi:hypothetical protein
VLGGESEPSASIEAPPRPKKRKRSTVEAEQERVSDERNEAFYERMTLTREVEALVEALYKDFLILRLGDAWSSFVAPALASWVSGSKIDADRYRKSRDAALASSGRAPPARPRAKKR